MSKLTKRVVDALKPDPKGGDKIYFDDEIRRFGVRVKASGVKSWVLQYKNKFGRPRRITIARVGEITPDQARDRAIKLKASISGGADPSAERKGQRDAITVEELCDDYLEAGKGRIKESTLAVDRSRIARHVTPLLGKRAVSSLTHADLEKFLRDVMTGKTAKKAAALLGNDQKRPRGGVAAGGPAVASRTLGMLGTILERAVRDGVLPSNPARGIGRPKEAPKKPPFSFEMVVTLGATVRTLETSGENPTGLRAIRFLALTGLRRMEALTLKWGDIDRRSRCIRFADTKSGAQIRPLGRAALDLLLRCEPKSAQPGDYVFPGALEGKHLVGLPKIWERVAKAAGIRRVSIHGLRHWYASAAAEMNFSELTIAGLLGHRVKGVTARYATAPDSALLAAADRVSTRLSEALDGRETGAKVVNIGA